MEENGLGEAHPGWRKGRECEGTKLPVTLLAIPTRLVIGFPLYRLETLRIYELIMS